MASNIFSAFYEKGEDISCIPFDITPKELNALDAGSYLLIDTRDEEEYEHGFIPGCILLSPNEVLRLAQEVVSNEVVSNQKTSDQNKEAPDQNGLKQNDHSGQRDPAIKKHIILYCRSGKITENLVSSLRSLGFPAQNLEGGYSAWAIYAIHRQAKKEELQKKVEEELQKGRFHRTLLNPFVRAIIRYELIQDGDHIAVCVSGGKDSMLMAKLFQEFQRHGQFSFQLTFLCMDPGYNSANRKIIESNAELLGIPLSFFNTSIFDAVYSVDSSPCYLCARMRRGFLYREAQKRGCNKIALGHHYDDVIETVLMGMLYSGQWSAMMPKVKSANFEGMELIRPLYFVREEDIKSWRDVNHLHFIQCACRFTDTCTTCAAKEDEDSQQKKTGHKRTETKRLIAELKKTNPNIETNLFHATENVHIDQLLGYKKDGISHSFLENY